MTASRYFFVDKAVRELLQVSDRCVILEKGRTALDREAL